MKEKILTTLGAITLIVLVISFIAEMPIVAITYFIMFLGGGVGYAYGVEVATERALKTSTLSNSVMKHDVPEDISYFPVYLCECDLTLGDYVDAHAINILVGPNGILRNAFDNKVGNTFGVNKDVWNELIELCTDLEDWEELTLEQQRKLDHLAAKVYQPAYQKDGATYILLDDDF